MDGSLSSNGHRRAASQTTGGQDSTHSSIQKPLYMESDCFKTDIFFKDLPELMMRNGSDDSLNAFVGFL